MESREFIHLEGCINPGNSITTLPAGLTPKQCAKECLDHGSECVGFEYFTQDDHCVLVSMLDTDGCDNEAAKVNTYWTFHKEALDICGALADLVTKTGSITQDARALSGSCSELVKEDLPPKCNDKVYNVGLIAIPGPHFFIGATLHDDLDGNDCPPIVTFASVKGKKEMIILTQKEVVSKFSVHDGGTAKLGDILKAEEDAKAIAVSAFNLATNSCAHYALSIWRSLKLDETAELANFTIENALNDENFESLVKASTGGLGYIASKTLGGKAAMKGYLEDIVFSQLNIATLSSVHISQDNEE